MGKNKKKKASDYKDFISMLKDNKEKIYLMKNDEKISLSEAVTETVGNITAVVKEGIIPISSEDAAKKKTSGNCQINLHYAKAPFTLYEYSMKHRTIPQTLVLTLTEEEVEDLFDFNVNPTVTTLMERTNIGLILKKMEKQKTKIKNWLKQEPDEAMEMFVVNIPDIVLFTSTIQKKEISKAVFFNLCIEVVKTKKKLSKLQKKDPDAYTDLCKSVLDNTLEVAISLGNSYVHIEPNFVFIPEVRPYMEYLVEKATNPPANSLINYIIYTFANTDELTEASNVLFEAVLK